MINEQESIRGILDEFRSLSISSMLEKGRAKYRRQQINLGDSNCRIEIYAGIWRYIQNREIHQRRIVVFDTASEGVEILAPILFGKRINSIEVDLRWFDLNISFTCGSSLEVKAFMKTSNVPVWRLVSGAKTLILGVTDTEFELAGSVIARSPEP